MKCNTLFVTLPPHEAILSTVAPLGQLYLATELKNKNVSVKILDCAKEKINWKLMYEKIESIAPQNIGLTLYTSFFAETRRFITDIRNLLPQTKIILGGPHATAFPKPTFTRLNPDILVKGEGEHVIFPIIESLNNKRPDMLSTIPGLIFRDNSEEIIETPGVNRIKDLDALAIPDWSLLPPEEYPYNTMGNMNRDFPVGGMITSRGCKYNCPFCAGKSVYGSGVRYRSTEHVLEEIKLLVNQYGVKDIAIYDENFANKKEHAFNICKAIIDQNIKVKWCLPNGIKIQDIDDDLIDVFKRSGCHRLILGLETLDEEVQRINRKLIDIEKSIQTVQKMRKAGIVVGTFIIVGLPGETKRSVENTYKLLKRFRLDFMMPPSVFVPTAGSEYSYKFGIENNDFSTITSTYTKGTGKSYCELSWNELKKYQRKFVILAGYTMLSHIFRNLPYIRFKNFMSYLNFIRFAYVNMSLRTKS